MIFGRRALQTSFNEIHCHDIHEIGVPLTTTVMEIKGISRRVYPGDVFFIPANIPHGRCEQEPKPFSTIYFCFDQNHFSSHSMFSLVEIVETLISSGPCFWPQAQFDVMKMANEIITELEHPLPFTEQMVTYRLAELLIEYARHARIAVSTEKDQTLLEKTCCIINQRPSCSYTLDWAAKHCCMSRSGFMTKFKRFTGRTFVEYLHAARINRALQLCACPELSIAEIALESGFENLGHFHLIFKRQCGMSPRQYRNIVKTQGPFPRIIKEPKM